MQIPAVRRVEALEASFVQQDRHVSNCMERCRGLPQKLQQSFLTLSASQNITLPNYCWRLSLSNFYNFYVEDQRGIRWNSRRG